jgi:plasmid stabilization system protein ParE
MRIYYHPSVRQDVGEAVRRYKAVSEKLAEDFKEELRLVIAIAAANPKRYHALEPGLHRANLKRFPYHLIYREIPEGIRVTLVRHHHRHPNVGRERQ